MAEQSRERVGVYIDFDNIVISRYNQLHGKGAWAKDRVRGHDSSNPQADQGVTARINQATIDVSAILDYASSFGSIVISRAYADWSAAVNARYQKQLNDRAVDLTQLFPTVLSLKNGADIRLAVDVVEDVFRLDDLTHIVIVAGDSDYIPLAQRCKRLGRYVVGIGVSGATSSSLAAACDEFADYDSLPGIASAAVSTPPDDDEPTARSTRRRATKKTDAPAQESEQVAAEPATEASAAPRVGPRAQKAATSLLTRAMELLAKNDLEWQHASVVKSQMRRMDPSFQERTLGYSQFSDFLTSRDKVIELDQESPSNQLQVRLRV
ncbi:NYN domain-containing protein [Glaciibacter superstes]|uniref:NYN domain-containing protein n=1 Tax=Glaciibacter superstes TaxID=501023 RepID=UPI00047CE395|nr:NYN domain-containing protein [Glaciibacter superstes]